MLGDNPEKSKNPLKKAFGRRNAKTVQFTAPTYHDAPDIDYSTDEEDEDDDGLYPETIAASEASSQEVHGEHDQTALVEPPKVGPQSREHYDNDDIQSDPRSQQGSGESESAIEKPRTSEEIFDRQSKTRESLNGINPDLNLSRQRFIHKDEKWICSEYRFFLQGRYCGDS